MSVGALPFSPVGPMAHAMRVTLDARVRRDHPDLRLADEPIEDLEVLLERPELEAHKRELEARVRRDGTAEALKDEPRVRAYRDFFWGLGIDPTKTRPAAEALVRRIVRDRPLPRVNTAVDALNVASVETYVAFAAFDVSRLAGDLTLRYARPGEAFLGIGMDRPMSMGGRELVIEDGDKLVAVYPYRDADASKLTLETESLLLLGCGVPGLGGPDLVAATGVAAGHIRRYSAP